MAPINAIPTEPPTWRKALSTAEPTPALSTDTAFMAAALAGVITSAMPMPPIMRLGRIADQNDELASRRVKSSRCTASSTIPVVISQREPTRSAIRPPMGATRMTSTVIGRKAAPACTGEKPRMFCIKSEMKKKTPNIESATSSTATLAPTYVGLRKSARSSIGARRDRSMTRKAVSESTATTKEPTIRAEPQPYWFPSMSP